MNTELHSFVVLPSFYEAIAPLPDEMRLAMFDALFCYGCTGRMPDGAAPMVQMGMALIRPILDSAEAYRDRQRENGKRGGRPKKDDAPPFGEANGHGFPWGSDSKTQNNPIENWVSNLKTQNNPDAKWVSDSETQKNLDVDIDVDFDVDVESIRSGEAASAPAHGKKSSPRRKKYGKYGWVKLSDEEYQSLLNDLGAVEVERCIAYVDESAQTNSNKNGWRDWNLVIRRCARDRWGVPVAAEHTPRGKAAQLQHHGDELSPLAKHAIKQALAEGGNTDAEFTAG